MKRTATQYVCTVCEKPFAPFNTMQKVCGTSCARKVPVIARKEDRAKREKLKSRSQWLKEAQQAFNAWIRLRDADKPCISCGRHHEGQWHAGHYLSTGARPELRFYPLNVHKQCSACNTHLSGNLVLYRAELVRRIGLDKVEWLEGPHDPSKPTIDELKALRDHYRALVRGLSKDQPAPENSNQHPE